MRVSRVLVRFYKSFNFDYEAKASGRLAQPWEEIDGQFYPFVEIGLEPDVTAVVGANESGKSHLVSAVEILLDAKPLSESDFCRYSRLFSVEVGKRRLPDVGGDFTLNQHELEALRQVAIPLRRGRTFRLLRASDTGLSAVDEAGNLVPLDEQQSEIVKGLMPRAWRPDVNVPLPDAVPLARLLSQPEGYVGRRERTSLLSRVVSASDVPSLSAMAPVLFDLTRPSTKAETKEEELARTLLIDVARVAPSVFEDLRTAIHQEKEGLVNGLVQQINASLARHLNLARWWSQDSDFSLRVSPREHELVFTIRDRTGTDYSTGERSTGLIHFLGYLVQFQAHVADERGEVLVMDEPDAYLSASGQQDLLRLIDHYARPDDSPEENQGLYVTHSPFLVNRNAGHRIRVLDKGADDEGTRVVKDVTRNRYEPLRSSIGVYVAETAFIGGANLFVEGVTDQVLLAGTAALLERRGVPASARLDLNNVTVVNCGSASSVPYMLYIARGQDEIKPPSIVLLDSDKSGKDARGDILKGGAYGKPLVNRDYICLLGEWAVGADLRLAEYVIVHEIEDLLTEGVAISAARKYAENFLGLPSRTSAKLKAPELKGRVEASGGSMIKGLRALFFETFGRELDKFGLIKEVIRLLETSSTGQARQVGAADMLHNFELLQAHLAGLLQRASAAEAGTRRDRRLIQTIKDFTRDYDEAATRDAGSSVLRAVESIADSSDAGDAIRASVSKLRRDFNLDVDPMKLIPNFSYFKSQLEALQYAERLSAQSRSSNAPEVRNQ